jgi:hypothetical protein
MDILLKISLLSATTFTGILCGASLDQSFKQLPARHKIGMISFSAYAKSADLKNGVLWYGIIGIGSTLANIVNAIVVWRYGMTSLSFPVYAAAVFAICHSICTSMAAPTYFKQKNITDEKSLTRLFNKFEIIQTIRSVFIVLNFASLLWVLAILF